LSRICCWHSVIVLLIYNWQMIGFYMISLDSSYSCFLLLSDLPVVLNRDWKSFWLSVNKVNLSSFCTVVSCFLSCFYKIKVLFRLMFYEALILEFKWITSTSDWATMCSSCSIWLSHWSFWKIMDSNVVIGPSCWRWFRTSIQILWSGASTLLRLNSPF